MLATMMIRYEDDDDEGDDSDLGGDGGEDDGGDDGCSPNIEGGRRLNYPGCGGESPQGKVYCGSHEPPANIATAACAICEVNFVEGWPRATALLPKCVLPSGGKMTLKALICDDDDDDEGHGL